MSRFVVLLVLLAVAYATSEENSPCPENAQWNVCGTLCEPTCEVPRPNPRLCPAIECTPNFTGGCRCKNGYVRSKSRECIALENC